jgi:DNA-binding response OmpR family regulator
VSLTPILLIEDNPQTSRLFNKVLVNAGHPVYSALTLHEAHHLLREHTFALIVLDLYMPDGSGLDFLGDHQKAFEQSGTKVVVVSAADHRVECNHLGVHLYLDKPLLPSALTSIVQQMLGTKHSATNNYGWLSQFLD